MKKEVKRIVDEIVVDGRDVERAQRLAMKRGKNINNKEERTVRIAADEILTTPPEG